MSSCRATNAKPQKTSPKTDALRKQREAAYAARQAAARDEDRAAVEAEGATCEKEEGPAPLAKELRDKKPTKVGKRRPVRK